MSVAITFPSKYRLNEPPVAVEVIEGEAVLINFDSGSYYSSQGLGSKIIEFVREPTSIADLAAALAGPGVGRDEELEALVTGFIEELVAENLVVPVGAADDRRPSRVPSNGGAGSGGYDAPVLHKYTDLADLLLLDPIHDADAAGWPNGRADRKSQTG